MPGTKPAVHALPRDDGSDVFPLIAVESQALYRRVNERILELAGASASSAGLFVCECSRAECSQPLDLSPLEYETVRRHGSRFVVATGHDDPSVESTVARTDRYLVVEKEGLGLAVALESDPRHARPEPA